ncbi:MAG: hypothetical protein CVT62_04475 [Actinobacteria bacterium HGW-Actinobacteria-2]|nr:MAG: hypothetical protein CVT62_04475 [Actinobacteria bacterium HGW-Actinobacteria-2]
MKLTKPLVLGLAAGLAVTALAVGAPAFSDPVSNSYVLVGSDTLQDSANALVNGTDVTGARVRIKAAGASLANYDAFPTTGAGSSIQTKPGGVFFPRPSGSGAGVNALKASINGTTYLTSAQAITGQVDIARSSSGPGNNANDNGLLAYVPYARDGVAYAYRGDAKLANLTTDQLKAIYQGTLTSVDGVTVKPLIPQADSGTRKFFLSAIGATCALTDGSCTTSALAENDASVLKEDGNIIPISAGSWIAQSNGVAPSTIPTDGSVKLGSPDGTAPFNGTGTNLVPNATFYNTIYGRDTYLVVERARITPGNGKYDPALFNLMDQSSATSLTNFITTPDAAGAVKQKFGFVAPKSTAVIFAYATLS